jgi:lipopolysaccharide transport system permease protein
MSRLGFLFLQWLKRDLEGRYRGSWLGLLWPLVQPIAQIAVFTLIFHGFMNVRWPSADGGAFGTGSAWDYAQNVLAGLAVFNFFSEVLGRAPSAILSNPNLVTKVRFPLLLLPIVTVASATTHIFAGLFVLLVSGFFSGTLELSALGFVPWILPVTLYGFGLAVLLASLGVYVRDIGQLMPAITSLLMFLTPIFYPLAAVPEALRGLFAINPVAWGAESLRSMVLGGSSVVWSDWGVHLFASAAFAMIGLALFRGLAKGFADVL